MNPEIRPYQLGVSEGQIDRSQQTRRDNDDVVVPNIGLYDIDYAIFYHLTEKIGLFVISNSVKIPVPVMFGNGEKWSQVRQHGFLRDNNKKILTPIVILRRVDVTPDDRISLAAGQLWGGNSMTFVPMKTTGMQYDRTMGQYATKDSYEYYLLTVPEYVRVNYEMIIWTDLQEQMNQLVQMLLPVSNHMWGDYYTFRTQIQSVTHDNVNVPGEDRLIKTTISLLVDGYLRNEYVYNENSIQKSYSVKRINFLAETDEEVEITKNTANIADTTNIDNKLRKKIRL